MAALRRSWRPVVALAAVMCLPGVLAGAAAAGACWTVLRTPRPRRRQVALLAAVAGVLLLPATSVLFAPLWPSHHGLGRGDVIAALLIQVSLGPAWLLIALPRVAPGSARVWVGPAMALGHSDDEPREAAASEGAGIRLGVEDGTGSPFWLRLPGDLGQHVTLLGVTGSGKTTTAERIAAGALEHGWPVLIIDAKGGGLRESARRLAAATALPYGELVPGEGDQAGSLRYNPCRVGSAAQVADKLVGAFSFSAEAEIFRNVAQETLAVITRALRRLEQPVTVRALRDHLGEEGLNRLSVALREQDPPLADELRRLAKRKGVSAAGYEGMRARLGVLLQGMFGPLFEPGGEELDLAGATERCGVTYISLPALAAPADVVLFAKVLVQDLKQLAHEREREPGLGHALVLVDEFAALDEPRQIEDLFRQARSARLALVAATQHLPGQDKDGLRLRKLLLGNGTIISHRLASDDAEDVAAAFGTQPAHIITRQLDPQGGPTKGSVRVGEEYRIHPNRLKELSVGCPAILCNGEPRRVAVVHVEPVTSPPTGGPQ